MVSPHTIIIMSRRTTIYPPVFPVKKPDIGHKYNLSYIEYNTIYPKKAKHWSHHHHQQQKNHYLSSCVPCQKARHWSQIYYHILNIILFILKKPSTGHTIIISSRRTTIYPPVFLVKKPDIGHKSEAILASHKS